MEQTKHTPGPWIYSEVKGDHVVHGPEGDCITWCNGVRAPNAANARLIAAAPDLLAALRTMVDYMLESHEDELTSQHAGDADHDGQAPEVCSYCVAVDQARLAIARAEEAE